MHYRSFDEVLKLVRSHGPGCYMAKSDLDSAFHQIPMDKTSLPFLGMLVQGNYYLDLFLPFGSQSLCAIFGQFSCALEWCVEQRGATPLSHYLDDFFFCHKSKTKCWKSLSAFMEICDYVAFPYAEDKTGTNTAIGFPGYWYRHCVYDNTYST